MLVERTRYELWIPMPPEQVVCGARGFRARAGWDHRSNAATMSRP